VQWVFGVYADGVKDVIVIYFLVYLMALATYATKPPTLSKDFTSLFHFIAMFAATALIMVVIPKGITGTLASFELVRIALGFALLWGFVKAYIEEIVFRWVLPKVAGLGDIVSNILFGAFHASVLFANATIMVKSGTMTSVQVIPYVLLGASILGILGYAWSKVRDTQFGLMGAVGSHTGYNLAVLGVLPILFGSVA